MTIFRVKCGITFKELPPTNLLEVPPKVDILTWRGLEVIVKNARRYYNFIKIVKCYQRKPFGKI